MTALRPITRAAVPPGSLEADGVPVLAGRYPGPAFWALSTAPFAMRFPLFVPTLAMVFPPTVLPLPGPSVGLLVSRLGGLVTLAPGLQFLLLGSLALLAAMGRQLGRLFPRSRLLGRAFASPAFVLLAVSLGSPLASVLSLLGVLR